MRDRWLNAQGLNDAYRKKRTLTNLYNARPTWLDLADKKLDAAVFTASGWPHRLSDEQILEHLLKLQSTAQSSLRARQGISEPEFPDIPCNSCDHSSDFYAGGSKSGAGRQVVWQTGTNRG